MDKRTLIKENPAAIAAVQKMTAIKLQGKGKRKVQATTALKDKEHPSHGKAVGIFQKLKDKFSKKKEDEPKKQSKSDADFYRQQYAARTGKELGESVKFHTITGNKRFMTKTALPILRKYGAKDVKVNLVGGDYLEVRFPIDSNKLKKLDKELKRKNKTAYGGIVENRRDKMKITEDILRRVIRSEIKKTLIKESSPGFTKREFGDPLPTFKGVMKQHQNKVVKEDDDAFSQPIPQQIDRYMKKFIDAVARGNLNRKRKLAILGRTIVALGLEPSEVSKYARMVKREL